MTLNSLSQNFAFQLQFSSEEMHRFYNIMRRATEDSLKCQISVELHVDRPPGVTTRAGRYFDTAVNGKGRGDGSQFGDTVRITLGMSLSEPVSAEPATDLPGQPIDSDLSERQIDVLRLLALGDTDTMIAEKLNISINTVKTHIRNIKSKLRTGNRTTTALKGRSILQARSDMSPLFA